MTTTNKAKSRKGLVMVLLAHYLRLSAPHLELTRRLVLLAVELRVVLVELVPHPGEGDERPDAPASCDQARLYKGAEGALAINIGDVVETRANVQNPVKAKDALWRP